MTGFIPWIMWDGIGNPPAFFDTDMVEVKYRDGRTCGPENMAHTFSGWNHYGTINDIVAYRITNKR